MAQREKFWLWFSLAAITSAITCLTLLALLLKDRPELVGYAGSVAGGLVGGAMTVAAGWVAWTAAQAQLAKQQVTLDLLADEHRKRSQQMLVECYDSLGFMTRVMVLSDNKIRRLEAALNEDASGAANVVFDVALSELPRITPLFGRGDFWRMHITVTQSLRELDSFVDLFNRIRTTSSRDGVRAIVAVWKKIDRTKNSARKVIGQELGALGLRQVTLDDDFNHVVTRPTGQPAPPDGQGPSHAA